MDGYAVCEQLRENDDTAVLPVIMVTSRIGPEKTKAIEAGADDFIPKPFNHDELLTRVRSLLRIKRYHDTIKAQAAELSELNRTLEERVTSQVEELERLGQLRRFLSPQLADAIVSSGNESILRSHRREVAMLFADLRGWTSFADSVEPEELMRVLREFHDTIGAVTNLASRLADEATGGQILIAQRLYAEVEDDVEVEPAGEFTLKGFPRPVAAFNVLSVREPAPVL